MATFFKTCLQRYIYFEKLRKKAPKDIRLLPVHGTWTVGRLHFKRRSQDYSAAFCI